MKTLLLLSLSLTACKWTEFDDLRDEAWVRAVTKPDGSKASNWGVGIVRARVTSASGGEIAIFGDNKARLNQLTLEANGDTKFISGDQDLAGLGIEQFPEPEPIVLADPSSDNFAVVTQGAALQVVVAAGNNLALVQSVIQGASQVDAAAYMVAPTINSPTALAGRTPQPAQPVVASGNKLFGTFFQPPENPFNQTSCALVDGATPVNLRAVAPFRSALANTTDDLAVWTEGGDMLILDGHVFNGGRSGPVGSAKICEGGAENVAGQIDISTAPATTIIGTIVDTTFSPGAGTQAQILPFNDHFAILQGHNQGGAFLALWDFNAAVPTSGALVGAAIAEPGLASAALFQQDGKTFVIAGYPGAVVDGVATGKVEIYEVDTTTGIKTTPVDVLSDAQPDDGEAFGRSVASMQFNGKSIIAVAGNNEVFFYYRTPTLYTTDARQ